MDLILNLIVNLVAKGVGTTRFCHEDLTVLDFGSKFTSYAFERRVTLENKGRRAQSLKWFNETAHEQQILQASLAKKKAIHTEAGGWYVNLGDVCFRLRVRIAAHAPRSLTPYPHIPP